MKWNADIGWIQSTTCHSMIEVYRCDQFASVTIEQDPSRERVPSLLMR
jgi:hypothetical protein